MFKKITTNSAEDLADSIATGVIDLAPNHLRKRTE